MNIFTERVSYRAAAVMMSVITVATAVIIVVDIGRRFQQLGKRLSNIEQQAVALEDRTIIIDRTNGKTNTMSITYSNRITGKLRGWHTMFFE